MLTYRLTGTTEEYGVDHDEPHQSQPANNPQQQRGTESSRTMVRLEDGAALLTWGFGWSRLSESNRRPSHYE